MKKRTILRVVKEGTQWIVRSGRLTLYDGAKLKAKAISAAFRHAKRLSPAIVRLYSAEGKLQVESEW